MVNARNRDRCALVQLNAEGDQQRLLVRETHPVRLPGMALHLYDELGLARGASLEPAVAMKGFVHDSSPRP